MSASKPRLYTAQFKVVSRAKGSCFQYGKHYYSKIPAAAFEIEERTAWLPILIFTKVGSKSLEWYHDNHRSYWCLERGPSITGGATMVCYRATPHHGGIMGEALLPQWFDDTAHLIVVMPKPLKQQMLKDYRVSSKR